MSDYPYRNARFYFALIAIDLTGRVDIKPENVMFCSRTLRCLRGMPVVSRTTRYRRSGRPIGLFTSHEITTGHFQSGTASVRIVDFGYSVSGNKANEGCMQVELYRAPEVVLNAGY